MNVKKEINWKIGDLFIRRYDKERITPRDEENFIKLNNEYYERESKTKTLKIRKVEGFIQNGDRIKSGGGSFLICICDRAPKEIKEQKKLKAKTKKDYLSNFTNYPILAKKVLSQIGDWKSIKENPQDYLNAANGISGFIYYSDTEAFVKRNIFLILKVLGNFQEETGTIYNGDQLTDLNWLAWFACETITHEIYQYIKES